MVEPSTPPSQEGFEASLASNNTPHQQSSAPSVLVASEISSTNPIETGMRTHSPSVPEQETELPLFVPQDNGDAVEVQSLSKMSDPSVKKERPMTPPPKFLRYSPSSPKYRFSSGVIDLTEDDDEETPTSKPPRQKVIEITSDGEYEDIDPSPRRQKPVKRESQSPKYRRKVSEEDQDMPMKIKDEDLSDPSEVNMVDEDSDGNSAEAASPMAQSSRGQASVTPRKETKPRKPQGKRAKTAREWHQRNQAKLSESQLRGTAYKLAKIKKIREDMKKDIKKRRVVKIAKRRAATRPDPRVFLNGGSENVGLASAQPDNKSEGGQPELHASTRRGFWKEFAEKHHNGVDLHQCKGDWNDLVKGVRSLGLGQLHLVDGKWRQAKLANPLLNHQVLGLVFMVKRECALDGPHGSIVADDMSYCSMKLTAKTILANPPTPEHIARNEKTTLIIVPSSLRSQWLREIKKHAPELGQSVMQFKSADPDNSATRLKMNDIVLTTYWEMCQSLPSPNKKTVESWKAADLNLFEQYQKWVKEHAHLKGLLHQITWYRHYIKNYKSRTSRAAIELKGDLRLLLSGTPIMNSYEEFHPLFRFLREPITMKLSPDDFEGQYCAQDDESTQCLSVLLDGLIIHRTMKDLLFGEPIVKLPLDHRSVKQIDAKRSEELLYFAIELRLKELRQMDFQKHDERSRLQNPLAQLTRLRQLTANPDIIAQQIIVLLEYNEIKKLQKTIGEMRVSGTPKTVASMLYNRFTLWLKDKRDGVYKKASLEAGDLVACMRCKEPSEELYSLKKCSHIFCEACLEENIIRDMEESGEEVMYCPKCSKPYSESHVKPLSQPKASGKAGGKDPNESTRKGKDARGFRPSPAPNQFCFAKWFERFDERKIKLLPSAKLEAIWDQVAEWIVEAPQDKIIIFSQFRHFQVIIGCMLEKEKMKFLYFSGDMSSKQREAAVLQFESDPSIKIMVAGLKCGGLGLNLSFANRVLIADIWWNVCMTSDNQAFGRVFRIGQEKESQYVKVVVKQTVDERTILALQRKKEAAIKNVMQDDITEADFDEILGGEPEETFKELMARYSADARIADSDDDMPELQEI
ncbi:hypothetical protein DL98DRAFT_622343 [Cadophora sp. DSE1049]|nr:hypothetical protein DL98DRAFT_622343 [Cadophora sp. DSE1049]